MFTPATKSLKTTPVVQQKTTGNSFFKKAGEETFFGSTKQSSFFGSRLQAKLTVSTPDDPQEKEADAVADKVMTMPEPVAAAPAEGDQEKLQKKEEELQEKAESPVVAIGAKGDPQRKVQAKCSCEQCSKYEHVDARLQTGSAAGCHHPASAVSLYPSDIQRQSGRGPPAGSPQFEQTLQSSKGSGSALPGDTKQFMESRFSADFSNVRVHTDQRAETLSRSVHAQAFAHGNDIYFDSGKYSPVTTAGRTLLAHELTHTIQQGASKSNGAGTTIANKPAGCRASSASCGKLPARGSLSAGTMNSTSLTGVQTKQQSRPALSNAAVDVQGILRSANPAASMARQPCRLQKKEEDKAGSAVAASVQILRKSSAATFLESASGSAENDLLQLTCEACEKEHHIQAKANTAVPNPPHTVVPGKLIPSAGSPTHEPNSAINESDKGKKAGEGDLKNIPGGLESRVKKENEKAPAGEGDTVGAGVARDKEAAEPAAAKPGKEKTKEKAKDTAEPSVASAAAGLSGAEAATHPQAAGAGRRARAERGGGAGVTAAVNAASPAALLHGLSAASYSSFAQSVSAASAAVPGLQQDQKEQLVQNLPRIQQPTGLPPTVRTGPAAPSAPQVNASSLDVASSGEAQQPLPTELPAPAPFAGAAAVRVAEPATTDEDSGSWWSWLTSRISGFINTLPTSDSGVSTDAGERPQVSLSGQADLQQNDTRQQLATTDVSTGVAESNNSTLSQFGEQNIYPSVEPQELSPALRPAAPSARPVTVQQYRVPAYARLPYDQATAHLIANAVNEKAAAYDLQQEEYQQQSLQIRQEGLNNIEQENLKSRSVQQQIQLTAQGEVNAQRQRWREENAQVQQTFADQSEAKRVEVNTQIQEKTQTAEQEADAKLGEAEREAEREKQKAEAEAQQKRQEAENKPESWWESFKGAVSSAFDAIRDAINAVFDALREVVRTIIRVARTVVNAIIDAARNAIIGFIRAFGDVLKAFVAIALAQFPEIAERARAFIDEQVNQAVDAVTEAAEALKEVASGILDDIGEALDDILSGLQGMFNDYMDWIADLARGLVDFLENGLTIELPDMTLFDQIAGNWDLPKLSTGDVPLWEARIEDPEDPCIFIAANVFVRADMKSSLSASLGPGNLTNILIRLNPFRSYYSGTARLRIPATGSITIVLTGVIGGKAFYTCGDIVRIEGGLEGTGTAGLNAAFTAQPTLTYDNGDISFTASPALEACPNLDFSLDAVARAALLDKYDWNGRWHLFDTQWSRCWNILGGGSIAGSLPGGGESGGGGSSDTYALMARGLYFNPEPLNMQQMLREVMGAGPNDNVLKAAKKGICDEVDENGKKKNPCEDEPGPEVTPGIANNCVANDNLGDIADSFISRCRKGSIRSEFPGELLSETLKTIKKGKTAKHHKAWKLLNDNRFKKPSSLGIASQKSNRVRLQLQHKSDDVVPSVPIERDRAITAQEGKDGVDTLLGRASKSVDKVCKKAGNKMKSTIDGYPPNGVAAIGNVARKKCDDHPDFERGIRLDLENLAGKNFTS